MGKLDDEHLAAAAQLRADQFKPRPTKPMMGGIPLESGVGRIATERKREIQVEGYRPEDDIGRSGELIQAAICYAAHAYSLDEHGVDLTIDELGNAWPWMPEYWKPGSAERDIEKAGALLAAALDAMGGER